MAARVRAFAKINLSLRVLGVRADGYHELRTVFQSVALHDTLTMRFARGPLRLTCSDPACPADRANLVWRAAEVMWAAAGREGEPRDVAIHLDKRIPMAAGLGGGSSDAAAALRLLAARWRVSASRLPALAATLGADVPYFLEGGTVLGLERGDLLFPLLDVPASWVVLVIPSFGVSTKEAFGWFDQSVEASSYSRGAPPPLDNTLAPWRSRVSRTERRRKVSLSESGNNLQAAVAARHPEITAIVRGLERHGAWYAAMSGSGSAVFGLFERRTGADRAARALGRGAGQTLVTRTVGRAAYARQVFLTSHGASA